MLPQISENDKKLKFKKIEYSGLKNSFK